MWGAKRLHVSARTIDSVCVGSGWRKCLNNADKRAFGTCSTLLPFLVKTPEIAHRFHFLHPPYLSHCFPQWHAIQGSSYFPDETLVLREPRSNTLGVQPLPPPPYLIGSLPPALLAPLSLGLSDSLVAGLAVWIVKNTPSDTTPSTQYCLITNEPPDEWAQQEAEKVLE